MKSAVSILAAIRKRCCIFTTSKGTYTFSICCASGSDNRRGRSSFENFMALSLNARPSGEDMILLRRSMANNFYLNCTSSLLDSTLIIDESKEQESSSYKQTYSSSDLRTEIRSLLSGDIIRLYFPVISSC